MTARLTLVAFVVAGWLGACGGASTDRCVGCPAGFADMTEDEHRQAACDGINQVRRPIASGIQVTGQELDEIINHARASGDEALDDVASDWANGIAEGAVSPSGQCTVLAASTSCASDFDSLIWPRWGWEVMA